MRRLGRLFAGFRLASNEQFHNRQRDPVSLRYFTIQPYRGRRVASLENVQNGITTPALFGKIFFAGARGSPRASRCLLPTALQIDLGEVADFW